MGHRYWHKQLTYDAEGNKVVHCWTSIALWVTDYPAQRGISQPKYEPSNPIYDPAGVSGSTLNKILQWVKPGSVTYRQWVQSSTGVSFDDLTGADNDKTRFGSAAKIRERMNAKAYSLQTETASQRNMEGCVLVDILGQQFRSYQEMARAICRQLGNPSIWKLLNDGHLIETCGDYPKWLMQLILIQQAFPTAEAPTRSPQHLGNLLKASCEACNKGNAPAAPELWNRIEENSGLTGEDATYAAGIAAARIVPVGPGPLHRSLNSLTDLLQYHRWIFEDLYFMLNGSAMPSDAKLGAKGVQLLGELLLAGWSIIRHRALRRLDAAQKLAPAGSRFDIAALIHLMEHSLLVACTNYDIFVRFDVPGDVQGNPDGDTYVGRKGIGFEAVEAIVRGRRNYENLVDLVNQSLYREKIAHSFSKYERGTRQAADENKGEGGIHPCYKVAGMAKHTDDDAARAETKRSVHVQLGHDPVAAAAAAAFTESRRGRIYSIPEIESRAKATAAFLLNIVRRLVTALPEDQPFRVSGPKTQRPTDYLQCNALRRGIIFAAVESGAYGHALFSQAGGNRMYAADICPASRSGCQMPGCEGKEEPSNRIIMSCGHSACSTCKHKATSLGGRGCMRCVIPITAKMIIVLKKLTRLYRTKFIPVSRLKMSSQYYAARVTPRVVHVAALAAVYASKVGGISNTTSSRIIDEARKSSVHSNASAETLYEYISSKGDSDVGEIAKLLKKTTEDGDTIIADSEFSDEVDRISKYPLSSAPPNFHLESREAFWEDLYAGPSLSEPMEEPETADEDSPEEDEIKEADTTRSHILHIPDMSMIDRLMTGIEAVTSPPSNVNVLKQGKETIAAVVEMTTKSITKGQAKMFKAARREKLREESRRGIARKRKRKW